MSLQNLFILAFGKRKLPRFASRLKAAISEFENACAELAARLYSSMAGALILPIQAGQRSLVSMEP